jgi:hypothetical protein
MHEGDAPPAAPVVARRQSVLVGVERTGWAAGVCGAITAAVGSVLPWTRFDVFGVDVRVPGVAGWGALTLAAAVVAVMAAFRARRLSLVGVLLGLFILAVAAQARAEGGRAVKARLLALTQALAPVNDRLLRVGLPPVEPFRLGQRWSDLVGPGPAWTAAGGALLALGSCGRFAAGRLRRSCFRCGASWSPARAGAVTFCPACAARVGPLTACPACRGPVEPRDTFCVRCAAPLLSG